jgi:peptidoglycan hydrolase CwlO-like protein
MARRGVALVATLLFAMTVAGSAGADTKSELEAAKSKLDTLIDRIAAENKIIQGKEMEIAATTNSIEIVTGQLNRAQAEILRLQDEITMATLRLDSLQHQLDRRAAVAYENGPGSSFEFLLGSTSMSDLSDRLEIVDHAAASDQDLIDQMRDQRAQLQTKQLRQQKLKAQLRTTALQLQKKKDELQAQLSAAQAAADQLNKDKADANAQVKKLEAQRKKEIAAAKAAAEARARLAAAQRGSSGGSTEGAVGHPFSRCPVVSGYGYGDDFGAPRYGGGYHPHGGNDIFAPLGTPIVAPFNGTASNASNSLGGNAVEVYGSAGYVYNAHLSAFGHLGAVSAGTVIGYVGNTGDAQGGAYHDHFEWHPNVIPAHPHVSPYGYSVINGGIDPYPYLNQVC